MEVNDGVILQLLNQLSGFGVSSQTKPWTSYGGVRQGPATVIQQARGQVQSLSQALLGPLFGGIVGPHAADFIVGKDFARSGMLHNRLSGLLAPQVGTYASAYQRMGRAQLLASLKNSRQRQEQALKKAFYETYYDVTNPGKDNSGNVQAALDNPLSLPSALSHLFDPAKQRQTMQGIKNTQAGFLNWQQRLNGSSVTASWSRRENAEKIGSSVSTMARNANLWQLGMQNKIKAEEGYQHRKQDYGGFTGAAISQLSSIIANASNVFDPGKIDESIKNFEKKVQATAKALSPLKDIFGGDIKAMTDMLQSVTGQNINQLSPNMISSIATSTVDMSRYSGATVTQIAQAGQKLFLQTAQTGQNSFARLGGGSLGAFYSGLIAQGNAPAGVHAAQYAGSTQRALASAQTSAGADFAAMAYGLWSDDPKNKGKSIDEFMTQVNKIAAGNKNNIMKALLSVSGAKTQSGLLKGLSTFGYREALQSGRMAQFGIKGQYFEQLSDAIGYMKAANTDKDITIEHWNALEKVLGNQENAAAIKNLITHSNDKQTVKTFADRFGLNVKAVNKYLNTAGMQQATARWASGVQIDKWKADQAKIRKQLEPLDKMGANGLNAFWQAASKGAFTEGGFLKVNGNVTTLGKEQIISQGTAIFGDALDKQEGKTQFQRVQKAVGKLFGKDAFGDQAAQVMALAGTQFANDQTFLQDIRTMATADKSSKDGLKAWRQAKGRIQARRLGYIGKQTGKDFKDKDAKDIYQSAMQKYQGATSKLNVHATDKNTKEAIKSANQNLQKELGKATRLQNISRMSASQLGLEGEFDSKKKALGKYIKGGSKRADDLLNAKSQEDFKTIADAVGLKGISKTQFQTAYRTSGRNYGNAADMQRMIYTVLDQLLAWLRKQSK